jgi:glutathione S-transferase
MALAHKGITPGLHQVAFSEIQSRAHASRTVPVLVDGDTVVRDSWDIACHLDQTYPQAEPLFPTDGDRRHARFMHHWAVHQMHIPIFRIIAADIWDALDPADQPYFRTTREKRLGVSLESVREHRVERVAELRQNLAPLRALLEQQSYLGGERPVYTDYIVFGALQWARVISPTPLLDATDPVEHWFERCLDLHGQEGRRERAAIGTEARAQREDAH